MGKKETQAKLLDTLTTNFNSMTLLDYFIKAYGMILIQLSNMPG